MLYFPFSETTPTSEAPNFFTAKLKVYVMVGMPKHVLEESVHLQNEYRKCSPNTSCESGSPAGLKTRAKKDTPSREGATTRKGSA